MAGYGWEAVTFNLLALNRNWKAGKPMMGVALGAF